MPVASALNLIGGDALYGRYWGRVADVPFLHFELCYYQAIELAIELGLPRVEAGAQGEQHVVQAGVLELARHDRHPEPAHVERRGEDLPVAAVPGEDEDRALRRARRVDLLPAFERDDPFDLRRTAVAEPERLREHRSVVLEVGARGLRVAHEGTEALERRGVCRNRGK